MKIGLIPMSAKPYHTGHDGLVRLAASECQLVTLFVSVTDRSRPGEIIIYGDDMQSLWKKYIEQSLPGNVLPPVYTKTTSSVTEMLRFLEKQESEGTDDTFVIYSDAEDANRFPPSKLARLMPTMYAAGQIRLRGIDRHETVNVSGTKMRQFLSSGDAASFSQFLPSALQPHSQQIIELLTRRQTNKNITKFTRS